jgi:hypothetical protein
MPIKGSIADVFQRQARGLPRFLHGEAERSGAIVVDEVRDRTPIGRKIDALTGRDLGPSGEARAGWYQIPVRAPSSGGRSVGSFTSGAANDIRHAGWLNDGTKRHIIMPREDRAPMSVISTRRPRGDAQPHTPEPHLRFWTKGHLAFAKKVNHPGTRGKHMAEEGLAAADARWQVEGETRLQDWLEVTSHA